MGALVSDSKVVSIRSAGRRASQPRTRTRRPEPAQASRLSQWLDAKATNGTVLVVSACSVMLTVALVAALVRSPAPSEVPAEQPVPEISSLHD